MLGKISSRLASFWSTLKLSARFALVSFFVLLISAFIIGSWITREIEDGVVKNTASTTAVYIETFVAPFAHELVNKNHLSPKNVAALEKLMDPMNAEQRVFSIKLWKPDGFVAYSSQREITGQTFPITPILSSAMSGSVSAEFDELHDAESAHERHSGIPMLEVYSPMRDPENGRTFAVAEFYVDATELESELLEVKLKSWGMVGATTLFVYALLFGIVHGGSETIDRQQRSLEQRVKELSALQEELQLASQRASDVNERFLRRIGSELHDGPAQLLGLAMLRLDALQPSPDKEGETGASAQAASAFDVVETSLEDALSEIRGLSSGLALPELANLSAAEVVQKATATHERRTGMSIETVTISLPESVSRPLSICIYRFIQESLTNAFRHAHVDEAVVRAASQDDQMTISVEDLGIGFDRETFDDASDRLGLIGLRDRIRAIGGAFDVDSKIGEGTTVTATFSLAQEARAPFEKGVELPKPPFGRTVDLRLQTT